MKTRVREEKSAAKAITANCVLSQSSINMTSEKDVANEKHASYEHIFCMTAFGCIQTETIIALAPLCKTVQCENWIKI